MASTETSSRSKKPSTIQDHINIHQAWRSDITARKTENSQFDQIFSTFTTWERRKFDAASQIVDSIPTTPHPNLSIDQPPREFITVRKGKRHRRSSHTNPQIEELLDQYVQLSAATSIPTFNTIDEAFNYYKEYQQLMVQQHPQNNNNNNTNNNDHEFNHENNNLDDSFNKDDSFDLLPSNTLSFDQISAATKKQVLTATTPRSKAAAQGFKTLTVPTKTTQTSTIQRNIPVQSSLPPTTSTPKKKLAPVHHDEEAYDQLTKKQQQLSTLSSSNKSLLTPNGKQGTLLKRTIPSTPTSVLASKIGGKIVPGSAIKTMPIGGSKIAVGATTSSVRLLSAQKAPLSSQSTMKSSIQSQVNTTSHSQSAMSHHHHQQQQNKNKIEEEEEEEDDDEFEEAVEYPSHSNQDPSPLHNRSVDMSVESLHLDSVELVDFQHQMQQRIDKAASDEIQKNGQNVDHVPMTAKRQAPSQLKRKFSTSDNDDSDDDDDEEEYDDGDEHDDESYGGSNKGSYHSNDSNESQSSCVSDEDSLSSDLDDDDYDTPSKKTRGKGIKAIKQISSSATKKSPSSTTKKAAIKIVSQIKRPMSTTKKQHKIIYDEEFDNNSDDLHSNEASSNLDNNNGIGINDAFEDLPSPTMGEKGNHLGKAVFEQIFEQRISPPLHTMNNLKLGSSHLQPSLHASLASPSRTASVRAFGKQGLGVANQQQLKSPSSGKLSGFSSTAKATMSKPILTQQQIQQQQLEKQRLIKEKHRIEEEFKESKKLENVYRYAVQKGTSNSTGIAPVMPLTPIITDKLSRAREVSRSIAAATPRFQRDPISIVMEPPGSDIEHDEIIPSHFIPAWAEPSNIHSIQEKQALVDADAIFIQPRANWCKTDQMFHTTIYHPDIIAKYGGPRRKPRNRGSSAYWGKDRLQDDEIRACNKAMGIYTDNY